MTRKRLVSTVLVLLTASSAALAQSLDIPLRNWTVPPYRAASASEGTSTMADVTPGTGFVGVDPCRIVDTRVAAGFPAGYGAPSLAAGAPRNFDLNSAAHCPGIPAGVEAYSLNITVTNTGGAGFIIVWPEGSAQPTVSTINYVGGQTLANAAIVPAGSGGGVRVIAGVSGTELIIDINGYFTDEYNFDTQFVVRNTNPTGVIVAINDSAGGGWAIRGVIPSGTAAAGSAAVRAENGGLGSGGVGVWGSHGGSGWGVFGESPGGFGVIGQSSTGWGVVGRITNPGVNRAGVIGQTGFVTPAGGYEAAGVRGEGRAGVLGISGNFLGGGEGVSASLVDGIGNEIRYAGLATSFGIDPSGGSAPWAIFGGGEIGATGTKHFLDPHPSDPNLMIAYVSLEGPEAGTYFRGRGKFQNGLARIAVPDHFRMVTDPEGLTVQITPIGGMASVGVVKMDLNEIVVQASRNLEFSYLVQGVRATFKDLSPYRTGGLMPRTADATIPGWLSPAQKRLLIQNGTYREDGTVNTETAKRLGWDKVWEERSQPSPQPTEP